MTKIRLSDKILPAFTDFHKALKAEYLYYVLKGGRASSKSTHTGIELVLRRMKYNSHALAIRKYGVYLEKSVYEQLKWAINFLDVRHLWHEKKSPLTLTYLPTGASIYFLGADDPVRIKSLMLSDMPITDLWVEEAADFKTEEEISLMVNTIVRGQLPAGMRYKVFLTYNPPKRKAHWLNKKYETSIIIPNTYIHHSDYRCNPYLSEQILDEIKHVEATNKQKYDWEWLGLPIGSGVVPFNNLRFEPIPDELIREFDNLRQGLDFGYANDPLSFNRLQYDKTRRGIYVFGEIYGLQISNRALYDKAKSRSWTDKEVKCDSAEPKSIAELKSYGMQAKPVKKGPDSVEYGERWLDDLEFIIIDPARCPNTTREFEMADYQVDRDGNIKNKLNDTDNHSIDAVRYAMNDDMKTSKWGW